MHQPSEIIPKQTVDDLVEAYNQSVADLTEGYTLLARAEKRLESAFGRISPRGCFTVLDRYHANKFSSGNPAEIIQFTSLRLRRSAWFRIVEALGLKKVMSVSSFKELDRRLESDEEVPDLTSENVLDLMMTYLQNQKAILEELVEEVYDFLRPRSGHFKSNSKFELKKKVILSYTVEHFLYTNRVRSYCQPRIIAVDRLFHLMDNNMSPFETAYTSPLVQAIDVSKNGSGWHSTDYFRFRCCLNGNLHLEFLRPDLVSKLNAIAGSCYLKDGSR
jgi:hypothetical protein